jgi:molybdate transport system substrate-binding protein
MKMRSIIAGSKIIFMLLLSFGITVEAAEVKVLSAVAMQPILEDLGQKFERATGHTATFTFDNTRTVVKRVQDGNPADVVVLPRQEIESFVKNGKAVAGNITAIASSRGFGVAVRKGATKPDISSPEALRRTLLAAKSISYSASGGADAIHVAKVLDSLGIAKEMQSKTVFSKTRPGTAGDMVAKGEAEIGLGTLEGFTPDAAAVEIVGPLPGDLQDTIVFAAVIMDSTKSAEASKALVDFLRTPEATAVIKANGKEPVSP